LSILGWATASFSDDYDTAREMVDRAVALNANSAFAWELRGFTYETAGQPEEAIRGFERAIRLSPFDPWLPRRFTGMGIASSVLVVSMRRLPRPRTLSKRNRLMGRPIAASRQLSRT
jgi:tetratricopeptide (TPR) repeat protein